MKKLVPVAGMAVTGVLAWLAAAPVGAQSDQAWLQATSLQYTIHYVAEYEADVAFVRRWLNATERLMRRKYGLSSHGYEVDVYLEPASTGYAGVGQATNFSGGDWATIHYMTPSAPEWAEARRQGRTTGLGRPFNRHHHAKTLVHEYITLAQERVTREKPEGFYYYAAPSWFYQGLEEYDGMFHTSPDNRTKGYEALLRYADTRLRGQIHCCQTLGRPTLTSSNPYFGGTLLLRFLAETYGEDIHAALLRRPEDTFDAALAAELQERGATIPEAFRELRAWFDEAVEAGARPPSAESKRPIDSEPALRWGRSENNRRARFYAITPAGRRRLTAQTEDWERIAGVMARLLQLSSDP